MEFRVLRKEKLRLVAEAIEELPQEGRRGRCCCCCRWQLPLLPRAPHKQ